MKIGYKIGYARVSTDAQETHFQLDALQRAKCSRIYQEKASGATADRPELLRLLDHARQGDVVIVWKLDRLARSLRQLIDTMALFHERGVALQSLTEHINTTTPRVVMKWTRPLCGPAAMSQNDFKTSETIQPQEASPVKHHMSVLGIDIAKRVFHIVGMNERDQIVWKRNKKGAIKHGFEGARELIVAWHGLRVCASALPLGGQCHFPSPRVLHS